MAILSKACQPDNFELHNSLKFSFANLWGLCLDFVDCESFLESYYPDILTLYETNLDGSIDSGNFSMRGYLPLIRKDSSTHMHCLAVYMKERLPLGLISRKLCRFLLMFSTVFTSLSVLLLFPLLITFFIFVYSFLFYFISINPSANVFVFGDFNIHHKNWLTYSNGTDGSGKLYYHFSVLNDLAQMVNFTTRIPDCDSHSPALLDFFLSFDASSCSTMAFFPLGNSDHVFVLVSIDFLSYSQQDAPFHCIAYHYTCADWDGLRDHLRDVPLEDIFKLSASAAAREFFEWV